MNNSKIADAFDNLADLLEFQGANPFRIRAYRSAARTVRDYPEPMSVILEDPQRSFHGIAGIGDDLAKKIEVLLQTGELPQLKQLKEEIPDTVLAMLRIPGLGPKKAAALHKELGIKTLEELKVACETGRVRVLKGFAEKTEQTILQGLAIAVAANQRMLWADADQVAQELKSHLLQLNIIQQLELAGSYRRGRDTVGDLDVLVVAPEVAQVMDRFACFPGVASILGRGDTKMSVRMESGLQIDLRVVEARSFGAALQYFTGSKDHNVVLRGLAKQRGLKINEYGVFRVTGEHEEYLAGESEADVYGLLDLPLFPPEIRESRQEYVWAEQGKLPDLVSLADIRGDLHMHTNETDGQATLEEMVAAARNRGLSYIAITDHSQRVSMARGLNPQRLLAQWETIDKLNQSFNGEFRILKGIECDILEKGGMDLPDDVLAQADWVLASIHYGQKQPRAQITERILGAVHNPYVTAIAHPTGRLLNHREAYEVDLDTVFRAVKEHRKMLELNANPMRLDLNDIHCAAARTMGIPIVINTDAHSTNGLDVMRFGILQARRGGLTRDNVANTRGCREFVDMLGK